MWRALAGRALQPEKPAWGLLVPLQYKRPPGFGNLAWKVGRLGFTYTRSEVASQKGVYYRESPFPALALSSHLHLVGDGWEKSKCSFEPATPLVLERLYWGSRKGWLGLSFLGKARRGALIEAVASERGRFGSSSKRDPVRPNIWGNECGREQNLETTQKS